MAAVAIDVSGVAMPPSGYTRGLLAFFIFLIYNSLFIALIQITDMFLIYKHVAKKNIIFREQL